MTIIYVDGDAANGRNNGSSWRNAFNSLQDALAVAQPADEIWVAEGVYTPTEDVDREISFRLVDFVKVYGGFAGNENSLNQRDFRANETILSGDIGTPNNIADNSFHVVVAENLSGSTLLDGFTITKGNAADNGGGIRDLNSTTFYQNLIIKNNQSLGNGGGAYFNKSATFINTIFANNIAINNGGGAYFLNPNNGDRLSGNSFVNVLFEGNAAKVGGGVHFEQHASSTKVVNSTFTKNISDVGSAIYHLSRSSYTQVILDNSIAFGNSSTVSGNQLDIGNNGGNASFTLNNTILENNPTVEEGGLAGGIDEDPLFINPDQHNYRLRNNSPAINAGNNTAIEQLNIPVDSSAIALFLAISAVV